MRDKIQDKIIRKESQRNEYKSTESIVCKQQMFQIQVKKKLFLSSIMTSSRK